MSPSIQTLIDEYKKLVFEKNELEYQDNSILIEFLPLLVNQECISEKKTNSSIF